MEISNPELAEQLRQVAAALTIKKGNTFQIRAYETAADAIEHSTTEVKDLWQEDKLSEIPGIGESLEEHLKELFSTGQVKHWQSLKKGIPEAAFEFLDIPGVGPKTALELADLGAKDRQDLKEKLENGELVKKGFSAKISEKVLQGLEEVSKRTGRMLLPVAFAHAEKVLDYLKLKDSVERVDSLGSLRRMVSTIGDLDFAVASKDPEKVVELIAKMPGVSKVIDQGKSHISVYGVAGLRFDFIIGDPDSYGALLQHFTGSKHHNIHLRTLAEKKDLSLSEFGVKDTKTGKVVPTKTEDDFYSLLKMQTPAPEIREDTGEIEAAVDHKLPKLIELENIKGDLHMHTDFPLEPSHGPGVNSIAQMIEACQKLGYSYIGLSDHPPGFTTHSEAEINDLIKKRTQKIEELKDSKNRVLNLLEVDILPDGTLSVPDESLKTLDFAMAGVHSSHRQSKDQMTARIMKAMQNPYLKVITHPTGRLINQRESFDADWEKIFKYAADHKIAMEINAYPDRLDLRDDLVRMAQKLGVKFVINTDSHAVEHLKNMFFGVAVARRGWLTKEDVLNTWEWKKFAEWFNI